MRTILISLALLAACTPPAPPPAAETPTETASEAPTTREEATARDTCGASAYRSMIGSNVAAIQLPANDPMVRVIMPDTVGTHDFRPDRVNIIAGADGVITSVECY